MKRVIVFVLFSLFVFTSAKSAQAASYTLFGDASVVGGGNPINAVEVKSIEPGGWGEVGFEVPAGLLFSDLAQLSTDYKITEGDCGGGAPRFQVRINGKNVFVYIGPLPNFTGCVFNSWESTGNFVGATDARFDLSQFGGPWYGTYAQALSLLGGQVVTGISVAVDAEWIMPGNQVVLFDNVTINGDIYTFDPAMKSDVLMDSGVSGKGLETAPGLQKTFNPKSKAELNAGKK